jgi:hypothetical protein
MTDREVERALGYTPCVCGGVLDGTWHPKCYRGKTDEQIAAGYARAFANARRHLKRQREEALRVACGKTPNVRGEAPSLKE